jgi:RNA polymerase sigma-70 factor, ECF subfamily
VTASNFEEDVSDEDWLKFVRGLSEGQPWAYDQFWARYGKRLEAVTAKHFPPGLNRRLEPQDIVQSTCRSFFMRMVDGRLTVGDADGLWGLLCAIALNKTRMKQRFHLAQRRAINRERDPNSNTTESEPAFDPSSSEDSPEEPAIFSEQLELAMEMLDPIERKVLQLKLEDYTHEEIAEKIQRSDRTIRRVVVRIQEKLQNSFESSE